jgi:hypothetical protein
MQKAKRAKYCFAEPRRVGTCIGTSFSPYIANVDMMILGWDWRQSDKAINQNFLTSLPSLGHG